MIESLGEPTELLFSYGTLQLAAVQLATFGRLLEGAEDHLVGYEKGWLEIADASVVQISGESRHPIVTHTGRVDHRVRGTVLRVTIDELQHSDTYEVAAYRRECLALASGKKAWVYVDARDEKPYGRRPWAS